MKIIFLLKGGSGSITWEIPVNLQPEFNFIGCARGMRCDGFFQADDLHIRYEEVGVMIFHKDGLGPEIMVPTGQVMQ